MRGRTTTITFTESADRKLDLFIRASKMGQSDILCEALEYYIPFYLSRSDVVREKYEAEEARLLHSAGLAVLPRRGRPRKVTQAASPQSSKEGLK
jgi:hypothetical protein